MYEDIKEQFRQVIIHSQGIPDPKVDNLFNAWEKSKKKFIDRFGGLIYEWPIPVEFTLDPKEKRSRAMDFANQVHDNFNNPVLAEFIDENLDSFFENKVTKVAKGSIIPEGMKLVKAFKYFEHNKKTLRSIQDMASQLIQENKIKGTLCFSVHPLDFLSSSENTYNWRSCHSLDGEYRAGNLSYMIDNSTVIVYLKGADNVHLNKFGNKVKWNSKKWRMLLHIREDDELMFAGRQYPFNSKTGMDIVLNIYNNLIASDTAFNHPFYGVNKYVKWKNDYVDSYTPTDGLEDEVVYLNESYTVINGFLYSMSFLMKEGINAKNYNDVLHSTCYMHPYYTYLKSSVYGGRMAVGKAPIIVGEEVYCLHCGDEIINNSETMRCDKCELYYGYEENDVYGSCDCCGARIYIDDAYFVSGSGEYVCEHCYDTECFVCDCCDETYYKSDRHYVPSDTEDNYWYCSHCYENHE